MGSISRIIPPNALRPYLIDAVERGSAGPWSGPAPPMIAPGWLTRSLADVPAGDGLAERARAGGARRAAVAGAKGRLASWPLDGEGGPLGVGRARARRGRGRGQRRAGGAPRWRTRPGSDLAQSSQWAGARCGRRSRARARLRLEATEARSGAFVRTWLTPDEQVRVGSTGEPCRARLANLIWAAKESATKARSEGLRLDVGRAAVELHWTPSADGEWRLLSVRWDREGLRSAAGGARNRAGCSPT